MNGRLWALFLMLLLLLSGCKASEVRPTETAMPSRNPTVIGYTSGNMNNPFAREFLSYVQAECDARGVELIALDGQNDVARQAGIVQQWTREGVSAILCSPVNPTALQASVDGCLNAGIPFVNLDSECERKTAYIGVDQFAYGYAAGRIAAEWINENLPDEVSVLCAVLTKPQSLAVIERANGIVSALEELCPRAKIVDTPSYSDLESARRATADLIKTYPELRCIVGVADVSVLGAYEAIREMGLDESKMCLVGLDATREMLELLQAGGAIRGTVSQNTALFAKTAVDIALDVLEGKEVEAHVFMELVPVTPKNAGDFLK